MKEIENQNSRILGKGQWVSNDDIGSGYNNNDLIIGGSGSGKTGGYVIPNVRLGNENMIITDTKSTLYRRLGKELRQQGYDVSVLDFANPEKSDGYNPLSYIRVEKRGKDEEYSNKDIVSLARILVPIKVKNDPFWEDSARTVMSFLIAFTMEGLRKEDHCMTSVVELFRQLNREDGRKRFELWCMEHPNSFAAKKYAMFQGIIHTEKTWSCITQFLAEALEPYDFREMEMIFGNKKTDRANIRFSDLWQKKKAIFLNISDTDRYADRTASLFYTQAFQVLLCAGRQGNLRQTSKTGAIYPGRFRCERIHRELRQADFGDTVQKYVCQCHSAEPDTAPVDVHQGTGIHHRDKLRSPAVSWRAGHRDGQICGIPVK